MSISVEKELVWSLVSSLYSLVSSVVSGVVHLGWLIRTNLVRSELKSYPVKQTYGFDKNERVEIRKNKVIVVMEPLVIRNHFCKEKFKMVVNQTE